MSSNHYRTFRQIRQEKSVKRDFVCYIKGMLAQIRTYGPFIWQLLIAAVSIAFLGFILWAFFS